jgi:hypothetical protein
MPTIERTKQNAEWAKSFDVGVLQAGEIHQYQRDSPELRPGIKAKGFYNGLTVLNNSDEQIAVDFDMMEDRRRVIPAHSAVPFTNVVPFQELNVENLSATPTDAGEVYITVRYERDVLRSVF